MRASGRVLAKQDWATGGHRATAPVSEQTRQAASGGPALPTLGSPLPASRTGTKRVSLGEAPSVCYVGRTALDTSRDPAPQSDVRMWRPSLECQLGKPAQLQGRRLLLPRRACRANCNLTPPPTRARPRTPRSAPSCLPPAGPLSLPRASLSSHC